jgi:hypothetical protein
MYARKLRPRGRDKETFSNDQQGGKEDLVFKVSTCIYISSTMRTHQDKRVVLLEQIAARSIPASYYPPAEQTIIDNGNSIREVHPQCPVEPGDRSFPRTISTEVQILASWQIAHRKAGSLPNSAIKVNAETASITRPTVLRAPILKLKFSQ